jgi:hypothetical protein
MGIGSDPTKPLKGIGSDSTKPLKGIGSDVTLALMGVGSEPLKDMSDPPEAKPGGPSGCRASLTAKAISWSQEPK